MQLSWTGNSESDVVGYKVYYDTDASGYPYANSVSTGSAGTSYTVTGLSTGTLYYAAVAAIDSDGNESWVSNEVADTTQASNPSSISFQTQPGNGAAGSALSAQPVVVIQESDGGTANTASNTVTIAITSGSGASGATLVGTVTVDAINGVANFSGLQINSAASG